MDRNPIKDMRLLDCCMVALKEINTNVKMGNTLTCVLVVLPVFKAFFYPPGASGVASLTSTAVSVTTEDWVMLARDIQAVNIIYRRAAADAAAVHAIHHELRNDHKLSKFWQGVSNAFNQ